MTTTRKPAPIKCVAPWAGGKRTLAPRIVELLGEHDTYVEPFVGGCSILPAKPRAAFEIVNDVNPAVVNVLRVVRGNPFLLPLLQGLSFDKDQFEACRKRLASEQPTQDGHDAVLAACQLVVWWMGPNGLAGTKTKPWFATRHTKTGGSPSVRWDSFRRSLPALAERLQGVKIECLDWHTFLDVRTVEAGGRTVLRTFDDDDVAIYVDPPYLAKSFEYVHDFDGLAEHRRLAAFLDGLRFARVVVSYYDQRDDDSLFVGGSLLDELYPPDRWERHEVAVSKASANARTGATRTAATEILLVNRRAA